MKDKDPFLIYLLTLYMYLEEACLNKSYVSETTFPALFYQNVMKPRLDPKDLVHIFLRQPRLP